MLRICKIVLCAMTVVFAVLALLCTRGVVSVMSTVLASNLAFLCMGCNWLLHAWEAHGEKVTKSTVIYLLCGGYMSVSSLLIIFFS